MGITRFWYDHQIYLAVLKRQVVFKKASNRNIIMSYLERTFNE